MILITGAAGKTGRALVSALSVRGENVRAFVHHDEQITEILKLGANQVRVGDLRSRSDLEESTSGISTIYHICPNMHPDEESIGRLVISTARSVGVERVVYHSVLHPQTEAMPHHWHKLRVEETLLASGLDYVILQPAAYMQNILQGWDRINRDGVYQIPYSADTRLAMVDLEDVAEAAAVVLTDPSHDGATYELVGPEVLSQNQVASILSQVLERDVSVQEISRQVWTSEARQSGLNEYAIMTLRAMFEYYELNGFWGNPHVLTWLLDRPPRSFSIFVKRIIDEIGG